MVLRSERSLKSKMLSLVRTSKYVNDTSVLSILINIERVSKHSVIIFGLCVVTPADLEPG